MKTNERMNETINLKNMKLEIKVLKLYMSIFGSSGMKYNTMFQKYYNVIIEPFPNIVSEMTYGCLDELRELNLTIPEEYLS